MTKKEISSERFERIGSLRRATRSYGRNRINIGKSTIRAFEGRIRSGSPLLGEFPAGLSARFGEAQKVTRVSAIRQFLSDAFPRYETFSKNRIFKD